MYQIKFLVKNKEIVRFILYVVSALLIVYFFWNIYFIATSLDESIKPENEFNDPKYTFYDNFNQYQQPKTIDLNKEIGGKILNISFNLINIMFLIGFMLLLYIDERLTKKDG